MRTSNEFHDCFPINDSRTQFQVLSPLLVQGPWKFKAVYLTVLSFVLLDETFIGLGPWTKVLGSLQKLPSIPRFTPNEIITISSVWGPIS